MRCSGHAARWEVDVCLLRLAEPKDLELFREFLTSRRIRVRVERDGNVRAGVPGARTPLHERREVAGCVATWNALNPASPVELVKAAK
jgi:hypothetical protein